MGCRRGSGRAQSRCLTQWGEAGIGDPEGVPGRGHLSPDGSRDRASRVESLRRLLPRPQEVRPQGGLLQDWDSTRGSGSGRGFSARCRSEGQITTSEFSGCPPAEHLSSTPRKST